MKPSFYFPAADNTYLDRLEELSKISSSKTSATRSFDLCALLRSFGCVQAADTLNYLNEKRWSVSNRLCKNLQQKAFIVGISQDTKLFQFGILLRL